METKLLTKENDAAPFYHQIKRAIQEKIENKELLPGDQIPSIAELIEIYGVSKITVTKALSEMVQEGLLYGRQGKGVFVKSAYPALSEKEIVGIVITTGHLYESFSSRIIRGLMTHDLFPLVVDIPHDSEIGFRRTRMLIEKQPPFLVFDLTVGSFSGVVVIHAEAIQRQVNLYPLVLTLRKNFRPVTFYTTCTGEP